MDRIRWELLGYKLEIEHLHAKIRNTRISLIVLVAAYLLAYWLA